MRPPERIGRYRVQARIGVGGFAVVFRAHDEVLDDPVAIKILADNWVADADIRSRFLEEARLLRRIHSDHLVTVHDVGELDGGQPYFVMEFARRGSLSERLIGRGPAGLDPASARALTSSLADGLGALHRAGVVHRDVNPRNLLLQAHAAAGDGERAARSTQVRRGLIGDDERVLLGDLGLAKDTVRSGGAASVLGGTPDYHAPEQLDPLAPVEPAADIYAATGVLWAAITGTPPPRPADLRRGLVTVDGRWHPLFERGLAAEPDERFDTMDMWREHVLACLESATAPPDRTGPAPPAELPTSGPYKGLSSFQPEDAGRFFGRDALVTDLIDRLARDRTLVVGGPSGSGKSSLVRAGLIPAVTAGGLPGSERWPVALFTPGSDPTGELGYHLSRTARTVTQEAGRAPRADGPPDQPLQARAVADAVTAATGGLLLVIDQFEELFTQTSGRDEQDRFLEVLAAIVDPADSRVRLVVAMRADFYARSALFEWLARRITVNQVLVGPMTRSELRQAIEGPAHQTGLRLEEGLVEAILDDGGGEPGALPLVSHALAETWRRRRGTRLTLAGYRAAGGVAGALAQSAEAVFRERLDETQRRAARRLLLRLVTPGEGTPDTRRPLPLRELDHDVEPDVAQLVATELTDARLLTVDRDRIEVAHEALIHSWPRLREWIEESRDDLRMRLRIDRAGAEWEAHGREHDLLFRGTPLQSALEWSAEHGAELSPAGRDLLEASRAALIEEVENRAQAKRRSRRIRRAAVALLAALTCVAVGAFLVALSALDQATARLAQSLGTQALALVEEDPRLALALGVESIARAARPPLEARAALVDGSGVLHDAVFAPAAGAMSVGDALSLALRPDGRVLATGDRDGTVRLWDTVSGRALSPPLHGHDKAVQSLAFTPDGRWLVSGGHDGAVLRWHVDDPSAVSTPGALGTTGSVVWAVAVNPSGDTVAATTEDGAIRLWDLHGEPSAGERIHTGLPSFLSVAFGPQGDVLLAGDGAGEVRGWRLPDREPVVGPFPAHGSDVWEIAFDPSGQTFATSSSDGRVRLWETTTGEPAGEPFAGTDVRMRGVQISPDGRSLLTGDERGRIRIWNLDDGEEMASTEGAHAAGVDKLSLSAEGDVLATLGLDQGVQVWTSGVDELGVVLPGHEDGAFGLAISPAGDRIATGDGAGLVRVFDIDTGELRAGPLRGHRSAVWALDFDADGTAVASGGRDGTVLVHDLRTGEEVARAAHGAPVSAVIFDGRNVFSGGDDGAVRRWDGDGQAADGPLGAGRGAVTGMAWGPDGVLLVADAAGDVRLWDPDDDGPGASLPSQRTTVWGVAWSAARDVIATASADFVVTLWDADSLRPQEPNLSRHPGGATGADFLADGATLVTSSRDGTVQLWDVELRRRIGQPLRLHDETVWRVVAHPRDARFATSSEDGTVRIWDVLERERACERAEGAFDDDRRRRYLGPGQPAAGCR